MNPGTALTEVTRRDVRTGREVVESVHTGHLVVTDAHGGWLGGLGDPGVAIFPRSAIKPLQAAACLELSDTLGTARAPSPAEVAVAWASHRGEARHLAAVRDLLERSGTDPERLTCPPAVAEAEPGATSSRLQHNCSGKHAMFALAGRALGVAGDDLLAVDGPVQRAVLQRLEADVGRIDAVGVDGCGAPAVVTPLAGLASSFARLATEPRFAPVREAGLAHPGLVGGEGRLESALLAVGVVSKVGAEGVYGVGWRSPDGTGRGLAVKAADGASRAAAAAVAGLLEQLGVVPEGTWTPPPPLGGGRPAGEVRASAEVVELADRLRASGGLATA